MSLNECYIQGNLGADPDVRSMSNGDKVANLSIAVTDKWTDKASGERRERTEWVRCCLFGPVAGIAEQYLRKGDKCLVRGRLQTRKWTDQSGVDRYSTEVVVDRAGKLVLLDSKPEGGQRPADGYSQQKGAGYGGGIGTDLDDSVPF